MDISYKDLNDLEPGAFISDDCEEDEDKYEIRAGKMVQQVYQKWKLLGQVERQVS